MWIRYFDLFFSLPGCLLLLIRELFEEMLELSEARNGGDLGVMHLTVVFLA